ncbi:MAG: GTPase Era [Hyphomicrobium sp.]
MSNQESADEKKSDNQNRCAVIALLGLSNSGKSTLVNRLVGAKVAITSHKIQTTRAPLRGITIEGKSQLIFVDTPGIFDPKRIFDRVLLETAWNVVYDSDFVIILMDASKKIEENFESLCKKIELHKGPKILVLNKIDKVSKKENLLSLVSLLKDKLSFDKLFMISALNGDGLQELRIYLANEAPIGPWLYPAEDISDAPLRVLAAEITREKIYKFLHEEIPYATTVVTESWKNLKNGSVRIEQTIYVEKESQKKIVIGKSGQSIKTISSQARFEISEILEKKVDLFLFVKVRENWSSSPDFYREVGLEYPKK